MITGTKCVFVLAGLTCLCACASADEKPDTQTSTAPAAEETAAQPQGPPPDGTVALDTSSLSVEPSGGMSRGTAARVALEGTTGLKDCYREALRDQASLELALALKVEIDEEGRGKLTAVEGAELPAALNACLADKISIWPYEWPSEPVVVTYPITFTPAAT